MRTTMTTWKAEQSLVSHHLDQGLSFPPVLFGRGRADRLHIPQRLDIPANVRRRPGHAFLSMPFLLRNAFWTFCPKALSAVSWRRRPSAPRPPAPDPDPARRDPFGSSLFRQRAITSLKAHLLGQALARLARQLREDELAHLAIVGRAEEIAGQKIDRDPRRRDRSRRRFGDVDPRL